MKLAPVVLLVLLAGPALAESIEVPTDGPRLRVQLEGPADGPPVLLLGNSSAAPKP